MRLHTYKFLLLIFLIGTVQAQHFLLSPNDFQQAMYENDPCQLLDLRSAEEFKRGHLRKAENIDYQKKSFEDLFLAKFNKKEPIFIYCFAGVRSADASNFLKNLGFNQIYELHGGFAEWTSCSKPYVAPIDGKPLAAITEYDLQRILRNQDLVMLDFYTDRCSYCKKMKPILEKASVENNFRVLKVEADKNDLLTEKFQVEATPTYVLFSRGRQVWRSSGMVSESEIKRVLRQSVTIR